MSSRHPRSVPRLGMLATAGCALAGCALAVGSRPGPTSAPPSTFDRLLAAAESGDPNSSNVVGYLLVTGRLAAADYGAARAWFEAAATEGHLVAQLNLAVVHFVGVGVPPDRHRADELFRSTLGRPFPEALRGIRTVDGLVGETCAARPPRSKLGSDVFHTFCSGCHGSDGVAPFGPAPSFAFGERLDRARDALLETIQHGHGSMPRWDDKLPTSWLGAALDHAHTLEAAFGGGLLRVEPRPGAPYFRFGPMAASPTPSSPTGEPASLEELCADL